MNDMLKPEQNKLNDLRKADNEIGALVADVCDLSLRGDYRRAAQAAAYLLLHLASKSAQRPFTLLRKANV